MGVMVFVVLACAGALFMVRFFTALCREDRHASKMKRSALKNPGSLGIYPSAGRPNAPTPVRVPLGRNPLSGNKIVTIRPSTSAMLGNLKATSEGRQEARTR